MKKLLELICAMLLVAVSSWAVPAKRGAVTVKQPDGSEVTIEQHGDEWLHFTTTSDGYTVVKDARGYYVYAQLEGDKLKATQMVAHDAHARHAEESKFLSKVKKFQAPKMSASTAAEKHAVESREAMKRASGDHYDLDHFKGLIILVEYNDRKFSREDYTEIINDIVNEPGYTGYDDQVCTGSMLDYFSDNSGGKFQPQFDVFGPYTIDYSQYDSRMGYEDADYKVRLRMLKAAVDAADADVDFSKYTSMRKLGGAEVPFVDLIYFVFAGLGSHVEGNDKGLWWPHRSSFFDVDKNYYIKKDNVFMYDYASSVELTGSVENPQSIMIDGVGTMCHEFSHVLGLPDFYDTDYAGSGGQSNHPNNWSLMSGGCYMNDSRTPVGYSLYERYAVGFIEEPPVLTTPGNYTLEPLCSSLSGYRIDMPEDDVFYLLENRQKDLFKWDAYLPGSGMLVHRVDKRAPLVWDIHERGGNKVNVDPSHNHYEVVRAGGPHTDDNGYCDSAEDVFPGANNVTELTNTTTPANLTIWDGTECELGLYDIQTKDGVVSFRLSDYTETGISSIRTPSEGAEGTWYNLSGLRTAHPTQKGVYLREGKKVVVK